MSSRVCVRPWNLPQRDGHGRPPLHMRCHSSRWALPLDAHPSVHCHSSHPRYRDGLGCPPLPVHCHFESWCACPSCSKQDALGVTTLASSLADQGDVGEAAILLLLCLSLYLVLKLHRCAPTCLPAYVCQCRSSCLGLHGPLREARHTSKLKAMPCQGLLLSRHWCARLLLSDAAVQCGSYQNEWQKCIQKSTQESICVCALAGGWGEAQAPVTWKGALRPRSHTYFWTIGPGGLGLLRASFKIGVLYTELCTLLLTPSTVI